MTRTIQQWALDAADHVQTACNLSGIVYAFENCIADLAAEGHGPCWVNRHPICVAWASKLESLSECWRDGPAPCLLDLETLVPRFETMEFSPESDVTKRYMKRNKNACAKALDAAIDVAAGNSRHQAGRWSK